MPVSSKNTLGSGAEKVVFHNKEHRNAKHFYLFTNPGMVEKWRKDKSIPLVEVLQSDTVYEGNGSGTTMIGKASIQDLENEFNTRKDDEIIRIVLEKGTLQHFGTGHGSKATKDRQGSRNVAQGHAATH